MKKVLFISSTGGHLNELMQLKPLFAKYDYHIITEKDKANLSLKEEYKDKIDYLPYGTRSKLFTYIFKYLYLCLKTIYLYIKIRPKYIVTTGTHTAGPMCYIGKLFGSKVIYIETIANVIPTINNIIENIFFFISDIYLLSVIAIFFSFELLTE